MTTAFGIFKVILSVILLTAAPFTFFAHLAQPPDTKTYEFLYAFLVLIPYGIYLFYSGQTQLMRLEVKKPLTIWLGSVIGLLGNILLMFYYFEFIFVFPFVFTISVQDILRMKKSATSSYFKI